MTAPRQSFPVRLVSGDSKGLVPGILRLALTPPSWLFAAASEARFALYRSGFFTRHRVPCPVISVGNLTVGGTGKTPLVEWVVREIRLLGLNPVVLSRGYGAREDELADELATLAANVPGQAFVRDPDRVRGALTAIERHCAEALVLDDGFQHHRLHRQVDLVTVDATRPFGGGHCLPRGLLREPVRALRRAHAVVLTRADQVDEAARERILRRVSRTAPRAALAAAVHEPVALRPVAGGEERPAGDLRERSVFAVSGIGNPGAFEQTLVSLGARVVGRARYPDHHRYLPADAEATAQAARDARADLVVTTQKDAVKWPSAPADGPPVLELSVRLRLRSGADEIRTLLRGALRGASAAG